MKQRLLVMNGQRLVQREQAGQWKTDKVEKAGALKPGIYNLYLSSPADPAKTQDGVIVYVDREHVYQQVGKSFVKHDRANFDQAPDIGSHLSINYDGAKAVVASLAIKRGRGIA